MKKITLTLAVFSAVLLLAGCGYQTATEKNNQILNKETGQSNNESPSESLKSFDISAKPFEFSLKEIKVKKGDEVKINLTVSQGMHDLVIDELNVKTKIINAGQSDSVEFIAEKSGTFEYYCSVANHRQMGMVGKIIIE